MMNFKQWQIETNARLLSANVFTKPMNDNMCARVCVCSMYNIINSTAYIMCTTCLVWPFLYAAEFHARAKAYLTGSLSITTAIKLSFAYLLIILIINLIPNALHNSVFTSNEIQFIRNIWWKYILVSKSNKHMTFKHEYFNLLKIKLIKYINTLVSLK